MTATTPVYGLKYLVQGEPMRATRQALEDNAKTIEAALLRGPAAPPNAQDLATLSGHVNDVEAALKARLAALEVRPGKRLYKPAATPTQPISGAWTLLTWESRDALAVGAGMWASTNPGRLVATRAGRYRVAATVPSNIATSGARQLQIRTQLAGSTPTSTTGSMGGAIVQQAVTGLMVQNAIAEELVLAVGDFVEVYAFAGVASTPFGTQNGYEATATMTYLGTTS